MTWAKAWATAGRLGSLVAFLLATKYYLFHDNGDLLRTLAVTLLSVLCSTLTAKEIGSFENVQISLNSQRLSTTQWLLVQTALATILFGLALIAGWLMATLIQITGLAN